jgi:hypothetical protein
VLCGVSAMTIDGEVHCGFDGVLYEEEGVRGVPQPVEKDWMAPATLLTERVDPRCGDTPVDKVWCRWVWVLLRGEVELESLHTRKIQQQGGLATVGRGGENRGGWWRCSPFNRIRSVMEGWTIGQVGLL